MRLTLGRPSATDQEQPVVEAARRGDVRAFESLVQAHQQLAYSVAYRILGNPDAAMDAVQEAFVRAYQALDSYRGGSFRAWLLRIATNCSYDQLRYHQRRPAAPIDDLVEDDEHSDVLEAEDELPEDYVARQELGHTLERALATLSNEQRDVVVMSDVHGLAYSEIASALNISIGTVKSRLSRARVHLRNHLLENGEQLPAEYRLAGDRQGMERDA
ncbi:MAG: sigma-70 family RNA polymerase sigma factor [Anaerolineae bacterium]|jgi:RNA polymerase sigma-70 factor (ECF subfamily)|nr:sigma-70 family RNA polymerase sigma factor [Chloroflexota bacterium]